ncbi:MAG: hypothetical protein KA717_24010 [Woronichinia naegeliana WA131]|uniref:Nucleoside phosphorylase domain-containing protein n=1 Tax=Woronichinia naegeliana WA131 TaxID=2824559 RepID=A0A977KSL2_9CYAN|nr:MAG: hypothetical protein KA717_24010 [Woronichinia naegeliana WA131]
MIVTALKQEFDALLEVTGGEAEWEKITDERNFSQYYVRNFDSEQGFSFRIAAMWANQMGTTSAAVLATRLTEQLKARCIAMCGICAGKRGDLFLGDVIVADRIFRYDEGKLKKQGENEIFQPDITTFNLNPNWKRAVEEIQNKWQPSFISERPLSIDYQSKWLLRALYDCKQNQKLSIENYPGLQEYCHKRKEAIKKLRQEGWMNLSGFSLTSEGQEKIEEELFCDKSFPEKDPAFNIHLGVVGTGNKVIQNSSIWEQISTSGERKIIALEMEGEAIGIVSAIQEVDYMIFVKGVCDYADEFKDDSFHHFSAKASAAFLIDFLKSYLPKQEPAKNSLKADQIKLQKKSQQVIEQVSNKIGGEVYLLRTNQLEKLEKNTVDNTVTIIVGASGVGKSSLVRDYAETQIQKDETVLWFDSRSFEKIDFAAFESDLQLANSLDKVVQSLSTKKGLLVLDGLDRLYNTDSFKLLSTFLRLFDFHQEQPQWRLLITCQNQDLSRLSEKLIHTLPRISFNEFICKPLLIKDLEPLWSSFPKASRLKYQTQLQDILGNLKILDLVATRLNLDDDIQVDQWVGESSVIEWFWNSYIKNTEQGISKSCLVQKVAEYQADNLKQRFPLLQTEQSQLTIIEGLIKDKIFNQTQDNSIVFQHDLYGDWFRLQLLISHSDNLASYLKDRLVSPMWHRAVRLYGQYLLENCRDVEKWTNTLDNLKNNDILLAQNLLLESPIFAADPFPLLVLIYQSLIANEGQLLKRLLAQFLISATLPDQQMLEISRSLGHNETEASANFRIPYWPLWLPILRFINDYRDELINIAPIEICQVVHLWLEHIPQNSIFRSEVAEIGLMLGKKALLAKDNYKSVFHKNRKDFYRVALMGAREFPEQISDFALRASERIARANTPEEDEELKYIPDKRFFPLSFDPTEPLPEPWPDGPKRRVDDDFRHVVLELQTILPLIQVDPSVAREVILAVLISVRRRLKKYLIRTYEVQFDIEKIQDWHIPTYCHGPFLRFLQIDFKEGLELIARLVNFATDRWLFDAILGANEYASQSQREFDNAISHFIKKDCCYPQPLSIVVNQCKYEFIGDSRVYGWSSGLGTIPPDEVVVALMALEQYFYLRIEREENIDEEITLVLKKVKSTAILGLLCNVGKRLPMLFEGPLKPLLGIPELYFWDIEVIIGRRNHLMIGSFFESKIIIELSHKFNQLEHRKKDLRHLACELFLTSSNIRDFFEDIRPQWEQRLSMNVESELRDFLKQLIITFDINNFEIQQHSKFGQVIVNVAAQKLEEEEKAEEIQAAKMNMLISVFPYRCREILKKDKCLETDELELLCQELQQIELIYIHKDQYLQYSVNQLAACILGGISVFIKFHQSWLDTYSERKQWCFNYIKNFIFEREHLTYAISINTYGQKNKTLNFIELYQKKK